MVFLREPKLNIYSSRILCATIMPHHIYSRCILLATCNLRIIYVALVLGTCQLRGLTAVSILPCTRPFITLIACPPSFAKSLLVLPSNPRYPCCCTTLYARVATTPALTLKYATLYARVATTPSRTLK